MVDARQHRPSPLVILDDPSEVPVNPTWQLPGRAGRFTCHRSALTGVEDRRHGKPAPGLVDREVHATVRY